jgi:hypothetical protein
MKLKSININKFKSIDNATLLNCGEFNVLIGKNNTGKSNILLAIQTFFASISADSVVTVKPPVDKAVDFYEKADTDFIKISSTFILSLVERDSLVQDIITDAPQMRNALEGIDPLLQMIVTLAIRPSQPTLGFISKITIADINGRHERVILEIGPESASELYDRYMRERNHRRAIEALNSLMRMDRDEWRFGIQNEAGRPRTSLRPWLQRRITPSVSETILSQLPDTPSFDDFIKTVQGLINKWEEEEPSLHETSLQHRIHTFAGEEASIPSYVFKITRKISDIKVLYLKEQRKQIGKR